MPAVSTDPPAFGVTHNLQNCMQDLSTTLFALTDSGDLFMMVAQYSNSALWYERDGMDRRKFILGLIALAGLFSWSFSGVIAAGATGAQPASYLQEASPTPPGAVPDPIEPGLDSYKNSVYIPVVLFENSPVPAGGRPRRTPTPTPTQTTAPATPAATYTPTATNTPAPTVAGATTYYVSPSGSDTNSGTSAGSPFKSIQRAVNLARNPGDTVLVMPGEYRQAAAENSGALITFLNQHGQAGGEIVLKAYDPGNRPRIIGKWGVHLAGSSYIIVDGLDISDFTNTGVSLYLSDHITVRNNTIHLGYEGNCSASETGAYAGCTYYPSLNIGEIKGRRDKTGSIIVEHDGTQNVGISVCKSNNNHLYNNRIDNVDEGIYVGTAGNVSEYDCGGWSTLVHFTRKWTEGNLIEANVFENPWNEAVELKPDARFNRVIGNIVRSTRQNAGAVMIEVRGHDNEIAGNVVVGAPNTAIRTKSEAEADPAEDRVEQYRLPNGNYKAAYRNNVHHNFIYYWAQFSPNSYGIDAHDTSAASTVKFNTVVGNNDYAGAVSDYAGIRSLAIPETVVTSNLLIGVKRVDNTAGSAKYESHLIAYTGLLPTASDYNGYFPRLKSNNSTCTVTLGSLGILCVTNSSQNAGLGYEYRSKFMDANPIRSDDSLCTKAQLLSVALSELRARIEYCSAPLPGSPIIAAGENGANIGAYPGQP